MKANVFELLERDRREMLFLVHKLEHNCDSRSCLELYKVLKTRILAYCRATSTIWHLCIQKRGDFTSVFHQMLLTDRWLSEAFRVLDEEKENDFRWHLTLTQLTEIWKSTLDREQRHLWKLLRYVFAVNELEEMARRYAQLHSDVGPIAYERSA